MKTLRVPDDGKTYPLPPGLGPFPVENLTHYNGRIPPSWTELGGVMIPMHQSEAMWINFETEWPTALKIATGTVNAINGRSWVPGLTREPQGYVVLPEQPWLDGYCAAPGMVRQFVATRMGQGYSAEEQILGTVQGGLQLEAYPVKVESYFEKKLREALPRTAEDLLVDYLPDKIVPLRGGNLIYCQSPADLLREAMGLGAGGRIKQEIYEDQWEAEDWDLGRPSRTWVHLMDAAGWKGITGKSAPGKPLTAKQYTEHGFPWFDYYRDDMVALDGSEVLSDLKPVVDPIAAGGKGDQPNGGLSGLHVEAIGPDVPTDKVKEWNGLTSKPVNPVAKPEAPLDQPLSLKEQKRLERQRAIEATNRFMLWVVSCGVIALLVWIFFMSLPSQKDVASAAELESGRSLEEQWHKVTMGEISAHFPVILQDHPLIVPDGFGVTISTLECKRAKWRGVEVGYTRIIYEDTDANLEAGIDNCLRSFRTDPRVMGFISQTKDFRVNGRDAKRTKGTFTIVGSSYELEVVAIAKEHELWIVMVMGPAPKTSQVAEHIFTTIAVQRADQPK